MHNFIAKFRKIFEICKKFAGNQVNEKGNVPRRGVVPTFSDLEVIALSITAEAFGIDSENYLFNRLNKECPGAIPNLITRRQYNQRRKLTSQLGEYIRKAIACAIDGGEYVVVAKRKGNKWFIGGITNGTPRDFQLRLDFLSAGQHRLTAFRDGLNADYQAMHYNKSEQTVTNATTLSVHMSKNGGWIAVVE